MNKLLIIFFVLIFWSCNGNQDRTIPKANTNDTSELKFMGYQYYENFLNDSLREDKLRKSVQDGNTTNYESVREDYLIGGYRDEFLFYAMLMAYRYEYAEAYFDVFSIVDASLYGSLASESYMYKKIADYNLIQAYIKGSKSAKISMIVRFGENFDSLRVVKYMEKLEAHLFKEEIKY